MKANTNMRKQQEANIRLERLRVQRYGFKWQWIGILVCLNTEHVKKIVKDTLHMQEANSNALILVFN